MDAFELAEKNPLMWMVRVNGLLVDLPGHAPRGQEIAFEDGIDPYFRRMKRAFVNAGRRGP